MPPITTRILDGMGLLRAERHIHAAWTSGRIGYEEYQNWLNYLVMGMGCRVPRLLDLFCGAGGAAMGYRRAGFEVVGVDIKLKYPLMLVPISDSISEKEIEHASKRRDKARDRFRIKRLSPAVISCLPRLREAKMGTDTQWGTAERALSPMRRKASGEGKTGQLVKSRKTSSVEGWPSRGCKRLLFDCGAYRQPIFTNGRQEGARI